MNNLVIKKWIEPYVLLESLKKKYEIKDLTFDGLSKNDEKQKMLKLLSDNSFGLYMKNVNKFYVFTSEKEITETELTEYLELSEVDHTDDVDSAIQFIDMAKAEAVILMN